MALRGIRSGLCRWWEKGKRGDVDNLRDRSGDAVVYGEIFSPMEFGETFYLVESMGIKRRHII